MNNQTALPIQLSRTPSIRSDTYRNERTAILWLERAGFAAWRMWAQRSGTTMSPAIF